MILSSFYSQLIQLSGRESSCRYKNLILIKSRDDLLEGISSAHFMLIYNLLAWLVSSEGLSFD